MSDMEYAAMRWLWLEKDCHYILEQRSPRYQNGRNIQHRTPNIQWKTGDEPSPPRGKNEVPPKLDGDASKVTFEL